MTKSQAILTYEENGRWKMTDGENTDVSDTIEGAHQAYQDCKAESDAFRPTISQDIAYELLAALELAYGSMCDMYNDFPQNPKGKRIAAAISKAKGEA